MWDNDNWDNGNWLGLAIVLIALIVLNNVGQ